MSAQNKILDDWDEIRTAYHVARLGTLSAAAKYLGVHHATVIRQINLLEGRLGTKLFHRHPRGYTATEAGRDLMQVAAITEEQLTEMAGRIRGRGEAVSGELIVTTISSLSALVTPILVDFQQEHPDLQVSLIEDERVLKLEYGEAHVALRVGPKPQEPDNVVQELTQFSITLYAHKSYVAKYGMLNGEADIPNHKFVVRGDSSGGPFHIWAQRNIPDDVKVFQTTHSRSHADAILAGAGIGFLYDRSSRANPDLVQMLPPRPEWGSSLWLVTHVNLHRTTKVQALVMFLKARLQGG